MSGVFTVELQRLDLDESVYTRLRDIGESLSKSGYDPNEECIRVARASLSFLGQPYEQHEELREGAIDCSTLTSQAHWLGALVGIPFIAESQRTAPSGLRLGREELLPGDVVVKYASLVDAPDQRFNHVGLYLGTDFDGDEWLIESAGGVGVRIARVETFPPAGGCRRFLPSPRTVCDGTSLWLAPLVPKLGRFGARQYLQDDANRVEHTGVDLYCAAGTPVFAPMKGHLERASLELETDDAVSIVNSSRTEMCILAHVRADLDKIGSNVEAGDQIGHVIDPPAGSRIRYVMDSNNAHLHFGFATRTAEPFGNLDSNGWIYHNSVYACNTKRLRQPIRDSAL